MKPLLIFMLGVTLLTLHASVFGINHWKDQHHVVTK